MSFIFSCAAGPEILITNVPQYRSTNYLAGLVHGVNPGACRVALFTYSRAAGWTTKSSSSDWLIPIQSNGSWKTDISTGGSDANATRIATLLVNADFKYPVVPGAATLSTNLFSQALASDIVTVPSGRQRIIRFSGYDWLVDSRTGGPGPNRFFRQHEQRLAG